MGKPKYYSVWKSLRLFVYLWVAYFSLLFTMWMINPPQEIALFVFVFLGITSVAVLYLVRREFTFVRSLQEAEQAVFLSREWAELCKSLLTYSVMYGAFGWGMMMFMLVNASWMGMQHSIHLPIAFFLGAGGICGVLAWIKLYARANEIIWLQNIVWALGFIVVVRIIVL